MTASDTGIQSAANIDLYGAATTDPPTTCINFITSADLTLDGKNVDVTSFDCAAPPTFVQTKQTIKSAKLVLKGMLDKADPGQALIWAEWAGALGTLRIKLTFGLNGTYYFNGPMSVDTIAVSEKASGGLVDVTYNLSSNGTCKLDS
jgi:hypothetical protein